MATTLIKEKTVDMTGLQIDATQLKLGTTVISATELSELTDTPSFTSATITTLTAPTITATDVDAGASGTAGTVDVFPSTASRGKLAITAAANAGNTTNTLVNASQTTTATWTIPDTNGSASFVMTAAAQTLAGVKTFSSAPVFPSAGITANATAVSSAELAALAGATSANATTGLVAILGTSGAITHAGAITPTGGVAAAGGFSVSPRNWHTGGAPAQVSTDGTDQTTVNTEVYIAEVFVPANATITGIAIMNGSAAANNVKVGLADSTGAVVATSGSTAHTGNDVYQRVPFTGTYAAKGPATYYVLTFYDTNAAQANAHTFGNFGAAKQTGQTYATGFTTISVPSTFTTALGPIASLY